MVSTLTHFSAELETINNQQVDAMCAVSGLSGNAWVAIVAKKTYSGTLSDDIILYGPTIIGVNEAPLDYSLFATAQAEKYAGKTAYFACADGEDGYAEIIYGPEVVIPTSYTDDPKIATEKQWAKLAERVKSGGGTNVILTKDDPGEGAEYPDGTVIFVYREN